MADVNETSPAPEYLGKLPFRSAQAEAPEFTLDVAAWGCSRNICEHKGRSACETLTGLYYGSAEDPVTKFCPRHFFEMHGEPQAVYRLVDLPRLSKGDVGQLVREADDAFWQVIARRFPQAKGGDLSPCRTIALTTAEEQVVNEWIGNNVNPQHGDDEAG